MAPEPGALLDQSTRDYLLQLFLVEPQVPLDATGLAAGLPLPLVPPLVATGFFVVVFAMFQSPDTSIGASDSSSESSTLID